MNPELACCAKACAFRDDRRFEVFRDACEDLWKVIQPTIHLFEMRRSYLRGLDWERMAWSVLRISLAYSASGLPWADMGCADPIIPSSTHDGTCPLERHVDAVVRKALLFIARPDTDEWRDANVFSGVDRFMNATLDELWQSMDAACINNGLIAEGRTSLSFRRAGFGSSGETLCARRQIELLSLSGLRRLGIHTCRPLM